MYAKINDLLTLVLTVVFTIQRGEVACYKKQA